MRSGWLMLGLLLAGVTGAADDVAAQAALRIVRGEVVAINLTDDPHVIVVRVLMPNKEELIVGATVSRDTHVTRKQRSISLADIEPGDAVVLGYLKTSGGLVARSIHVQ